MSFCQNHHNHHCVHSHQCKNQQHKHKQKKVNHNNNQKVAKKGIKPTQKQQRCAFNASSNKRYEGFQNKGTVKQQQDKHRKYQEINQQICILRDKNDKLSSQNQHLYAQIEYYRQQFTNLIGSNSQDVKNQIKKHLKESTFLNLKVNSLENVNTTLMSKLQRLQQQTQAQKYQKLHNQYAGQSLSEKNSDLRMKIKLLDKEREDYRQQLMAKTKELERWRQNYEILKKQFKAQCNNSKKQLKECVGQLDVVRKQFHKVKNTSSKEKELLEFQLNSSIKREECLKVKLEQFEIMNKQLKKQLDQAHVSNEDLSNDLLHAKRLIQRGQMNSNKLESLKEQLSSKQVQTHTVIRQRQNNNYQAQQNKPKDQSQQVSGLKQLVKTLKAKISDLESKNSSTYEQIILTIGASEAFRRLLQQKNQVIKKLMRQKGQLMSQAALQM